MQKRRKDRFACAKKKKKKKKGLIGTRVTTGLIVFLGFRASSGHTCAFIGPDLWFFSAAFHAPFQHPPPCFAFNGGGILNNEWNAPRAVSCNCD